MTGALLEELAEALVSSDPDVQIVVRAVRMTLEDRGLSPETRAGRVVVFLRELFAMTSGRHLSVAEAKQLSRCIHPPLLQ